MTDSNEVSKTLELTKQLLELMKEYSLNELKVGDFLFKKDQYATITPVAKPKESFVSPPLDPEEEAAKMWLSTTNKGN